MEHQKLWIRWRRITPMVLKAQILGYDVSRVFMDAGSGINQIYAWTLRAMNISLEFVQPTDYSFHGIVPRSATPCV
jgi:hypothetical protein